MVERLEMEHARSLRSGIPMAVIMMDIDHFKKVNDRHGHQAGDRALVSIAECIRAMVRRSDSCSRWGGEEFLVLCPDCDGPNAMAIAEKVRSSIEGLELEHRGDPIKLSISAGVSAKPKAAERPWDDIVREADEALYRAKKLGRNRVELYG
jgi:diguanylate cyclase (GGDEF)-like protein